MISLTVIPFLLGIISVEEFAKYDLFLLSSSILLTLFTLGLDSGIAIAITEHKDDHRLLSKYFSSSLFTTVVMSIIIGFLSLIILQIFDVRIFTSHFWIHVLLYSIFWSIQYIIFNFIRWTGNAKVAAFILFVGNSLGFILGFLNLKISGGGSIYLFLHGLIASQILTAIVSLYVSKHFLTLSFFNGFYDNFRQLLRISIPFVGSGFANQIFKSLDRFFILSYLGEYQLGLYSLIARMAQIPNFIIQIIASGFQPVLLSNYKTIEGQKLIRNLFHLFLGSFIPILIFIILTNGYFVHLFGGVEFLKVAYLLPIVISSTLLYSSTYFNGFGFFISKRTEYITYITVGIVLLTMILDYTFVAIMGMGIEGIALGGVISSSIGAFYYITLSEKLYTFRYNKFFVAVVFIFMTILPWLIIKYNNI